MNEIMTQPYCYPIDSLPPILGSYVRHLCFTVQVPPELVAPLVIASAAASVQGLVDVQSPFGNPIPTSLFCLAIPRSGDRVSAVMRQINAPITEFEEGMLKKSVDIKSSVPFASHQMILGKATEPGIVDVQMQNGDSLIASTDEGDIIFKQMDIPAWCKRWDGDVVRHNTRTAGAIRLKGKRTSMGITVQHGLFVEIMKGKGKRLLASGFLPRTLFSMPPSLQGYRLSPEIAVGMDYKDHEFIQRLRELLTDYALKLGAGNYARTIMHLSQAAQRSFWDFERSIEDRLRPQCELHDIPAFAAKAVENVIRLASVFEHVETGNMQVSERAVNCAIVIVWWHLYEAKRAFGRVPQELIVEHHANLLYHWLCSMPPTGVLKSLIERSGPAQIRLRGDLESALYLLKNRGFITSEKRGRGEYIAIKHPEFVLPR